MASTTTTTICQTPVPKKWTNRSPIEHPDRDADHHLADPAQPLPEGQPERDDRRDRGEERPGVVQQVTRDPPGQGRADAALDDEEQPGDEPGGPGLRLVAHLLRRHDLPHADPPARRTARAHRQRPSLVVSTKRSARSQVRSAS